MKRGVYIITNLINEKKYIGQGWIANRLSKHKNGRGSKLVANAIKKYGVENFTFKPLVICKDSDMDYYETEMIKAYECISPNGYNLESGGHEGKKLSQATKDKIGDIHRGKTISQEHKKIISNFWKGRKLSEDHKNKLIEVNQNRILSEKTKNKMSDAKKGKKLSIETRLKISESIKGSNNWAYGKKFTEEHVKNLSDSHKGIIHYNLRKPVISIDGRMYFNTREEAIGKGFHKAYEVAKGKRNHSKGIVFRFATEQEIKERTDADL